MKRVQLPRLPVCAVFLLFAALIILHPLQSGFAGMASDMYLMPTLKTPEGEITKIPSEEPPTSGQSEETWSGAVSEVGKNDLKSGDPIVTGSGSIDYRQLLFEPGGPMNLSVSFVYNRAINNWWEKMRNYFPANNSHNYFWVSPLSGIYDYGGMTDIRLPDGSMVSFEKVGDTYVLNEGQNGSPVRYAAKTSGDPADRFWVQDPLNDLIYLYELNATYPGDILYILDRNGNKLSYTYDGSGRITRISDGLGRTVEFGFQAFEGDNSKTYLHSISDKTDAGNPRTVTFGYEADPDMDDKPALRTISDPLNHTRTFRWSKVVHGTTDHYDNLVKVENPKGESFFHFENTWDMVFYKDDQDTDRSGVKVTEQKDAFGNTTQFHYNPDPYLTLAVYPDGTYGGYAHDNAYVPPGSFTDATGEYMAFERNAANQIEKTTDREGGQTLISYHAASGKIASVTNARGDVMSYTYTAREQTFADPDTPGNEVSLTFYNLTRIDYPDGTFETFSHDGKGNILEHIDPAGKTWTYAYNARGQVLTATNPEGGVTTSTYHDSDATRASTTDSDTGVSTYVYDGYKRLSQITHPDDTVVQITYDLKNKVTAVTDGRGNTYAYTYDANGNLASINDPDTRQTLFTHDLMDRVNETTNARGKKSRHDYDHMNRLQSITDPNTNTVQYQYNARGRLEKITDGSGHEWTTSFDNEGLPISDTTPMGRNTSITRDSLGYITKIKNPLNEETILTRDEMSRITRVTDPLDRATHYAYDNAGRLTGVTLPDGTAATYRRNGLGLVDRITDLKGSQWHLNYTSMGRLSTLTDPLNNQWQYGYDERGRLNQVAYPDGTTQTRTLDNAGNLLRSLYSTGPDLNFTYDNQNRLLTADNIEFTYNETGRVTATIDSGTAFGATYDDGGRLETLSYNNGQFSITYTHDARNLLTRVTDSLTGTAIDFNYDNDGRITAVTRPGGTNTSFTWDDASRMTRIQHGTLADIQYIYNAAGEITGMDYDLPLDPADYQVTATDNLNHDAASQIITPGHAFDTLGRQTAAFGQNFTWDGASRLTTTSDALLTYNGLNDLHTRQSSGTTIRYFYNYAPGLHPVVAEYNETTNTWKRFYVLAPDGTLLYAIDPASDNAVSFYHFDKGGNTLFLSNAAGTITDKYAYTPYGRLLAHQGTSDQPFTFGGAWGVRQENAEGLYHMRARYYNAVTSRFISREPLWPQLHNAMALNNYQYADADPIQSVDPTGLSTQQKIKVGFSVSPDVKKSFYHEAVKDMTESAAMKKAGESLSNGSKYGVYQTEGRHTTNVDYSVIIKGSANEVVAEIRNNLTGESMVAGAIAVDYIKRGVPEGPGANPGEFTRNYGTNWILVNFAHQIQDQLRNFLDLTTKIKDPVDTGGSDQVQEASAARHMGKGEAIEKKKQLMKEAL
jgi:RHS repeat-associated protein